jgi:hypothetical protein
VFFLLSDSPQFLLPTIVSRCQFIGLSAEETETTAWQVALLELLGDAAPTRETKAASFGPTMVLGHSERFAAIFKAMKQAAEEEEKDLASSETVDEEDETIEARASSRYREMRTGLMRTLLTWHRDLLLLVCRADEDLICHKDCLDRLKEIAAGLPYRKAVRNIETVETMNRQFEQNLPESLVLISGLGRLMG